MRFNLRPTTLSQVHALCDKLLRESDWTAGDDTELTPQEKLAWRSYRADLRAIRRNDDLNPAEVVFPVSPKNKKEKVNADVV